jgi:hypothetical protein
MGILDSLLGRKKHTNPAPVCASCDKPVPVSSRKVMGVVAYEGTVCLSCGKAYCLYCHNFGTQGPKCPGCGKYQLGPLMRAA